MKSFDTQKLREAMLLYAVTDRTWLNGASLRSQVEAALKGGITCLQMREKELDYDNFLALALELKALCLEYKIPFFINDNVDIAIACKADGIHVGQSDMEVTEVRKLIGDSMILGVSAQTVEQAQKAQRDGADCIGVGAVFTTNTKQDADAVSHDTLRDISLAVTIPVVAIGGISKENLSLLNGTHIDGVALISAIFASEDITKECKELKLRTAEMVSTCR